MFKFVQCYFLFLGLSSLSLTIVCLLVFEIIYYHVFFPNLSSCFFMLVHNYCYLHISLILFTIELWFFIAFKCKCAFNSQERNLCILSSTFHFIASFCLFHILCIMCGKKFVQCVCLLPTFTSCKMHSLKLVLLAHFI